MRLLTFTLLFALHTALLAQPNRSVPLRHSFSAYGGWTYATVSSWTPGLGPTFDIGLPALEAHHQTYVGLNYDYQFVPSPNTYYLSTGLALHVFAAPVSGASFNRPYAETLIGLPLLLGRQWALGKPPQAAALRLAIGVEPGLAFGFADERWTRPGYRPRLQLNGSVDLSLRWKRFNAGTRWQVGLNTFDVYAERYRYVGGSVYVGYTLVQA